MTSVQIRRASPVDASGIVAVLEAVAAERIHSAIDQVWSVEQEARYLASLSHREALHVAVDAAAGIVGVQSLDRWSSVLSSMAHVGQIGTFLLPAWRGRGVGRQLWRATEAFAREVGSMPDVHVAQSHFHDVVPAMRLGVPTLWINRLAEVRDPPATIQRPTLEGLADALDEAA